MSNKRITDLTELTTPTTDDVFPVVDIATNTTTKVQLGNLPTTTAVTTALATKQDTLVSGTNIKTVNSTSLVGSGNVAVQETLVSGTNIKTLNSTSLLGSGNIVLTANPSGVSGAIQFSNGSAFASDAANLFWDDTNNRLGVGTNAPTSVVEINHNPTGINNTTGLVLNTGTAGSTLKSIIFSAGITERGTFGVSNGSGEFRWGMSGGGYFPTIYSNGSEALRIDTSGNTGIGISAPTARLHIKGSGSTSATTSLLVQNSGGTDILKVRDDGNIAIFTGRIFDGVNNEKAFYFDGNTNVVSNYQSVSLRVFNGTAYASGLEVVGSGSESRVGIGTTSPNASAKLQLDSTTKGFLPPRMTTTERNAISSPAAGLVVYDNTTNKLQCYNGSTWNDLF